MSRADELRAQLAAAEAEEAAAADLAAAREAFRAAPDDPDAKEAAQAAAVALRAQRAAFRAEREAAGLVTVGGEGDALVAPGVVAASAAAPRPGV